MTAIDLKESLISLIDEQIPVFIWGDPGIGKSSIVKQIAKEKSMNFIDLRLSLLDPTDLRGIPFFNSEDKSAIWAKPEFLPNSDTKEYGILFLDEINSAPPTIQAAAYQLILDRKIGEYHLPLNYAIIAAGNIETNRGVTYRMPTPLANRFVHLTLEVDFYSWKQWAYKNNIDNKIISYLNYKPSNLFLFDSSLSQKAFATPRSWEYVNNILKSNLNNKLYIDVISGAIGEESCEEFLNFCAVMGELPNIDDIFLNKDIIIPTNNSVLYALCSGIVYALINEYSDNRLDMVLNFSLKLPSEFSVLLIKDLQQQNIEVEYSQIWTTWVEQNGFLLD